MFRKLFFIIVIFLPLFFNSYAQNVKEKPAKWDIENRVVDYNFIRKFSRGAANSSLGFLEVVIQTRQVMRKEGIPAAMFYGPFRGVLCAVGRTVWGVIELGTFLFPPYKPLVKPEFVLPAEDFANIIY